MKMSFRNPFLRIKNFDDKGFLRVSIGNFLELEGRSEAFYTAIKELQIMREGLLVAKESGLISQLASGFEYYKLAINWLRFNGDINQGVAVSAIGSYDDINEPIANSLLQYVMWVRDNFLANQVVYQNIQEQIGVQKASKVNAIELDANEYSEEFKSYLYDAQQKLASSSDERKQRLEEELSQQFNTQVGIVQQTAADAVNTIKQAQSLSIWHEAYEANIEMYSLKLNGRKWTPFGWKDKLNNFKQKYQKIGFDLHTYSLKRSDLFSLDVQGTKKELLLVWYLFSRFLKNTYLITTKTFMYLVSNLLVSLRAQRLLWFTVLGIVLIGQSLMFIIFLANGSLSDIKLEDYINPSVINTLVSSEYIFAKVSIFIGLILVPSLGYAFTNRNYRIYANLLEQYRHRATVAQTLQGILRYTDETQANADIRISLVTVAAVAMFEMKNVGHLSKRDGDTLPMAEVLQSIVKSK